MGLQTNERTSERTNERTKERTGGVFTTKAFRPNADRNDEVPDANFGKPE